MASYQNWTPLGGKTKKRKTSFYGQKPYGYAEARKNPNMNKGPGPGKVGGGPAVRVPPEGQAYLRAKQLDRKRQFDLQKPKRRKPRASTGQKYL